MKNRRTLDNVIQHFFSCDRQTILEIMDELISAMQAEEFLPPGRLMSRNYDTAQDNPEIHSRPGNLKDARDAIFPYFWGTDGWRSPLHLENVKGPPNFASLIGSVACLLKNPNLCVDTYCLRSNELEVKAIMALANLIFYHTKSPWGVFTMGGTISNLYGGKLGIEKVVPGAMQKGLSGARVAGLVSHAGHYSNRTLAGWLGMGTENLHSIETDSHFAMRLDRFEEKLDELYQGGIQVAFVIATFGSTDAFGIDDISAIRAILQRKADQYGQVVPHLHVDAAVGWVACFLVEYQIDENSLGLSPEGLTAVAELQDKSRGFRDADSVTLDFHKMGWGHYPSSAFLVNERQELSRLLRSLDEMPYFSEANYRYDPALFTLECSRPGIGPYSVMASLMGIGLEGYQALVANALELSAELKEELRRIPFCQVLNHSTVGPSVLFWVLPAGRDAAEIYRRLCDGELGAEERERYFHEIHRMFEKREATLDRDGGPRLSFTQSTGFKPHGIDIPAWKAVFFNPHATSKTIDLIIRGIQSLA
jgi:L-2,4-diaminobutyrate decarboxylase